MSPKVDAMYPLGTESARSKDLAENHFRLYGISHHKLDIDFELKEDGHEDPQSKSTISKKQMLNNRTKETINNDKKSTGMFHNQRRRRSINMIFNGGNSRDGYGISELKQSKKWNIAQIVSENMYTDNVIDQNTLHKASKGEDNDDGHHHSAYSLKKKMPGISRKMSGASIDKSVNGRQGDIMKSNKGHVLKNISKFVAEKDKNFPAYVDEERNDSTILKDRSSSILDKSKLYYVNQPISRNSQVKHKSENYRKADDALSKNDDIDEDDRESFKFLEDLRLDKNSNLLVTNGSNPAQNVLQFSTSALMKSNYFPNAKKSTGVSVYQNHIPSLIYKNENLAKLGKSNLESKTQSSVCQNSIVVLMKEYAKKDGNRKSAIKCKTTPISDDDIKSWSIKEKVGNEIEQMSSSLLQIDSKTLSLLKSDDKDPLRKHNDFFLSNHTRSVKASRRNSQKNSNISAVNLSLHLPVTRNNDIKLESPAQVSIPQKHKSYTMNFSNSSYEIGKVTQIGETRSLKRAETSDLTRVDMEMEVDKFIEQMHNHRHKHQHKDHSHRHKHHKHKSHNHHHLNHGGHKSKKNANLYQPCIGGKGYHEPIINSQFLRDFETKLNKKCRTVGSQKSVPDLENYVNGIVSKLHTINVSKDKGISGFERESFQKDKLQSTGITNNDPLAMSNKKYNKQQIPTFKKEVNEALSAPLRILYSNINNEYARKSKVDANEGMQKTIFLGSRKSSLGEQTLEEMAVKGALNADEHFFSTEGKKPIEEFDLNKLEKIGEISASDIEKIRSRLDEDVGGLVHSTAKNDTMKYSKKRMLRIKEIENDHKFEVSELGSTNDTFDKNYKTIRKEDYQSKDALKHSKNQLFSMRRKIKNKTDAVKSLNANYENINVGYIFSPEMEKGILNPMETQQLNVAKSYGNMRNTNDDTIFHEKTNSLRETPAKSSNHRNTLQSGISRAYHDLHVSPTEISESDNIAIDSDKTIASQIFKHSGNQLTYPNDHLVERLESAFSSQPYVISKPHNINKQKAADEEYIASRPVGLQADIASSEQAPNEMLTFKQTSTESKDISPHERDSAVLITPIKQVLTESYEDSRREQSLPDLHEHSVDDSSTGDDMADKMLPTFYNHKIEGSNKIDDSRLTSDDHNDTNNKPVRFKDEFEQFHGIFSQMNSKHDETHSNSKVKEQEPKSYEISTFKDTESPNRGHSKVNQDVSRESVLDSPSIAAPGKTRLQINGFKQIRNNKSIDWTKRRGKKTDSDNNLNDKKKEKNFKQLTNDPSNSSKDVRNQEQSSEILERNKDKISKEEEKYHHSDKKVKAKHLLVTHNFEENLQHDDVEEKSDHTKLQKIRDQNSFMESNAARINKLLKKPENQIISKPLGSQPLMEGHSDNLLDDAYQNADERISKRPQGIILLLKSCTKTIQMYTFILQIAYRSHPRQSKAYSFTGKQIFFV